MGKSNKKSATMALKEGKKEPEDHLETNVNLKKQKEDEIATLISDNVKNESSSSDEEPAKPAAKDSSSSEDESSTSSSDKEPAATDSSSSENESEDDSKDVRAEITSSLVSSKNRLEVRTKRGKRAAYTSQIGIGGNDDQTIIVKGFDSSLPEDDIKRALSTYFSSCGEIISVIVAKDPATRTHIGCAYIELKEGIEKALKLSGSNLGGWNLLVKKATPIPISDVGGPSSRGGHWPYPNGRWPYRYRCDLLRVCKFC
ncbi:hypothetical protein AALP_AA2G161100 [Arabis alpina]|uniref:RRM domain-containing protein n=1 Tax=Arabis alpina TaxID=50452 RepID=A0A087HHU3_ARAAL|nr:hypothetical protein AALP_AA2G161100 [Arabis alpina]